MPVRHVEKNVDEVLNFKEEKQVFIFKKHIDFDTANYNSSIKRLKPCGYYMYHHVCQKIVCISLIHCISTILLIVSNK